jgi:hypothetical protein
VPLHLRNVPTRVATGAYILHSGLSKWNGSEEQAKGVHTPWPPARIRCWRMCRSYVPEGAVRG